MKKFALLSAVTLVLVLIGSSPASAATAPSSPTPILVNTCDGYLDTDTLDAARSPDGKVHGFAGFRYSACGDKITYFEGAGTSWTVKPTSLVGKVVDVAADNTGTYLLYIIHEIGINEIAVVKRANDGTITRTVMAALSDTMGADGRGSIVAKNGTWYAVWPKYSGSRYVLYQANTMFGGNSAARTVAVSVPSTATASDTNPALTLGPDGQPRLFWQRAVAGVRQDLLLSTGASGAWGTADRVAAAVAVPTAYPSLDIAVTDKRTFLSWTDQQHAEIAGNVAVVAQGSAGHWSTSLPPGFFGTWDAHLVASSTTVFAAFGTGDDQPGDAYVGTKNGSNPWVTGSASNGIPYSIDTFGVAAIVYNGSGRTTSLIFENNHLYAVER